MSAPAQLNTSEVFQPRIGLKKLVRKVRSESPQFDRAVKNAWHLASCKETKHMFTGHMKMPQNSSSFGPIPTRHFIFNAPLNAILADILTNLANRVTYFIDHLIFDGMQGQFDYGKLMNMSYKNTNFAFSAQRKIVSGHDTYEYTMHLADGTEITIDKAWLERKEAQDGDLRMNPKLNFIPRRQITIKNQHEEEYKQITMCDDIGYNRCLFDEAGNVWNEPGYSDIR